MNKLNQIKNKAVLIGGSLLFIGIPLSSIAQTPKPTPSGVLNPKPSIFNEQLYRRDRTPVNITDPSAPLVPPLPEESGNAIATVTPINGKVSVKLTNTTNTAITYEAIKYTEGRTLAAKTEVVLKDLPAPVTITLVRPDNGFIQIAATSVVNSGLLEVSLSEGKTLNEQQSAIRIQQSGKVILN
ncbi:hypothetical protein [Synechocystis sp. PCC 7509]|uniref:hypothetical protein n=1 Tax=Synechocystis sp. PCC 7509 TaxID=927677 RepID=UPI0002ABF3B2|nr:hypothetical protein [Synechocystis sp. PCC 7509]